MTLHPHEFIRRFLMHVLPHSSPARAAAAPLPRFRALALSRRLLLPRADGIVMQASGNLHTNGHETSLNRRAERVCRPLVSGQDCCAVEFCRLETHAPHKKADREVQSITSLARSNSDCGISMPSARSCAARRPANTQPISADRSRHLLAESLLVREPNTESRQLRQQTVI